MDPVGGNVERLGQSFIGAVHGLSGGLGGGINAIRLHLGGAIIVVEDVERRLCRIGAPRVFEESLAIQARFGKGREQGANTRRIEGKTGHDCPQQITVSLVIEPRTKANPGC